MAKMVSREQGIVFVMNKNSASNSGAPKFLIEAQRVINAGRLLDAVEILKGGLAENEFTAARSIGDIYCVAGDHEKALKWFSRACECTENIDVRLKICRILLNRKDHKQALDELAVRLNSINKIEDASAYIDEYLKFGLAGKVVDVLCDSVNERRIDREAFIHNVTKTFRKKRCFAKLEKWYRHLTVKMAG